MKKLALFCGVFTILASISLCYYSYNILQKELPISDNIVIEIKEGDSDQRLFYQLSEKQLIALPKLHISLFKLAKILNKKLYFKSGEYEIIRGEAYLNLLIKIVSGDIFHRRLTISEGQTVKEAIDIINNNKYLSGVITSSPTEGSILPETYFFKKGDSREKLLNIMMSDMTMILNRAWQERSEKSMVKSAEELLILASIIEKETGVTSERNIISGVFTNRLRKRMRLQTDPTVIYAITKGQYKLERPLSKRDLRTNSPYNTYRNYGLPPTPIANPGKAAIFAAANPADTKYLYFVANGEGGHRFSTNLIQHNKNVFLLRKFEREQKANGKN